MDESEAWVEGWLARVARKGHDLADAVQAALRVVFAWLRRQPLMLWSGAIALARWLILVLPRKTWEAVRGFFAREVIPTSQFLVEVPVGLGSAALRDLLFRLPAWFIAEGPGVLAHVARWALTQCVVLTVAMFDGVEGLVNKLINAALLVYDSVYGGLRWLVVAALFHFAPWLFDEALSLAENLVSAVHSAILFALAARLWLLHAVLSLPRLLTSIATSMVEFFSEVIHAVAKLAHGIAVAAYLACVRLYASFRLFLLSLPGLLRSALKALWAKLGQLYTWLRLSVHQLPGLMLSLLVNVRDMSLSALSAFGDVVYATMDVLGRAIVSLVRAFIDLLETIAGNLWNLLWFLVVKLPREVASWLWNSFVATVRWFLVDLPRLVWSTLVFLIVDLPQALLKAMVTAAKETAHLLHELLRELMRPVSAVLTWALAVAIAPFYLVWHLFHPQE